MRAAAAGGTPLGEFVISSELAAESSRVWRHAVSPAGVNAEFRPLLRMTFPAGLDDLTEGWQPGTRRFRSWILALGFVPVDYDDICFDEVEPGRRFLERSVLLTQRVWIHERTVEPTATGCRLTDRVRFEPRWSWLAGVQGRLFRAVFGWRHRNLRRRFAAPPAREA